MNVLKPVNIKVRTTQPHHHKNAIYSEFFNVKKSIKNKYFPIKSLFSAKKKTSWREDVAKAIARYCDNSFFLCRKSSNKYLSSFIFNACKFDKKKEVVTTYWPERWSPKLIGRFLSVYCGLSVRVRAFNQFLLWLQSAQRILEFCPDSKKYLWFFLNDCIF